MKNTVILFIGPPGSGKTTHSKRLIKYLETFNNNILSFNLDCGITPFKNNQITSISDYIFWEEILFELHLGPNGGILFSLEYIQENFQWIEKTLDPFNKNNISNFLVFDLPGQIEIFSHYKSLQKIVKRCKMSGFQIFCILLNDFCSYNDPTVAATFSFITISIYLNLRISVSYFLTKSDLIENTLSKKKGELQKFLLKQKDNNGPFGWVVKLFLSLQSIFENLNNISPSILDVDRPSTYEKMLSLVQKL